MSKKRAPADLGKEGRKLWQEVTSEYGLRPDEERLLLDACKQCDIVASLEEALAGQPLVVSGSHKQPVAHPLISEIRQHRATLASLLRQLRLPDHDSEPLLDTGNVRKLTRSEAGRKAARARWDRPKGA